jgi:RimJ/RimL family protein N-acetyltransferase
VFKEFTISHNRRVVLRQPHRYDVKKLLVFINGLVDEKTRRKDSQLYTGFESMLTIEQEKAWLKELLIEIKNGNIISIIAVVNGSIVGNGEIVRGEYAETMYHGRLALTILATHRGLGIGREMIRALLAEAHRLGLKNVHVEFLFRNKQAVSAYRRAGFKKVGRIPRKVKRNGKFLDALLMAQSI